MSEEQTESHDENVVSSATTEAEAIQADASVAEKPEEPKKHDGFQKRIDQLTRKNYEAKQETADLKARLTALETKPVETKQPEIVAPKEDDFDDPSAFSTANANFIADKAAKAAYERLSAENEVKDNAARLKERQQELGVKQKTFNVNLESKRSNFEDYEAVAFGHPFMDGDLAELIIDIGDKAVEVGYHLGSNLEEAERIFKLSPTHRARELTRLEFKTEAVKANKVSGAPDPIIPLGNSESVQIDPDEMSTDAWLAYRNKQVHG